MYGVRVPYDGNFVAVDDQTYLARRENSPIAFYGTKDLEELRRKNIS